MPGNLCLGTEDTAILHGCPVFGLKNETGMVPECSYLCK